MTRGTRTGIVAAAAALYLVAVGTTGLDLPLGAAPRPEAQSPSAPARPPAPRAHAAAQTSAPVGSVAARPADGDLAAIGMAPQALLDQYCMGCHSDRVKAGGLALSQLKLDALGQHGD